MGEEFTQFDTHFSEALKGQLRSVANQLLSLELGDLLTFGERLGHRLAVHLGQLGLGIEGFQMRRTTGHTQPNHPPCLRWKVQGRHRSTHCPGCARRLKDSRLENGTQRHGAQALRRATQKQTSGLLLLKKLTDLRGWAHGQERVMVSWRLRRARATSVQAAHWTGSKPAGVGALPVWVNFEAASGSLAKAVR